MEKNKGLSPDPKRPQLFGPGNNVGTGRKPGCLTSKRARLTNVFVDKAESEWPEIVDTVFRMAKNENMKALDLIFSYCAARPVTVHNIEAPEDVPITQATKEMLLSIVNNGKE